MIIISFNFVVVIDDDRSLGEWMYKCGNHNN